MHIKSDERREEESWGRERMWILREQEAWLCTVYSYQAVTAYREEQQILEHHIIDLHNLSLSTGSRGQPPLLLAGGGTRYKTVKKRKEKRLGQGNWANHLWQRLALIAESTSHPKGKHRFLSSLSHFSDAFPNAIPPGKWRDMFWGHGQGMGRRVIKRTKVGLNQESSL